MSSGRPVDGPGDGAVERGLEAVGDVRDVEGVFRIGAAGRPEAGAGLRLAAHTEFMKKLKDPLWLKA